MPEYKDALAKLVYLQEMIKAGIVPKGYTSMAAAKVDYMSKKRSIGALKKRSDNDAKKS